MIKEKANIAVFISGRGTNLKALILRSNKKTCNYKIAYVISNKKNLADIKEYEKYSIIIKNLDKLIERIGRINNLSIYRNEITCK